MNMTCSEAKLIQLAHPYFILENQNLTYNWIHYIHTWTDLWIWHVSGPKLVQLAHPYFILENQNLTLILNTHLNWHLNMTCFGAKLAHPYFILENQRAPEASSSSITTLHSNVWSLLSMSYCHVYACNWILLFENMWSVYIIWPPSIVLFILEFYAYDRYRFLAYIGLTSKIGFPAVFHHTLHAYLLTFFPVIYSCHINVHSTCFVHNTCELQWPCFVPNIVLSRSSFH